MNDQEKGSKFAEGVGNYEMTISLDEAARLTAEALGESKPVRLAGTLALVATLATACGQEVQGTPTATETPQGPVITETTQPATVEPTLEVTPTEVSPTVEPELEYVDLGSGFAELQPGEVINVKVAAEVTNGNNVVIEMAPEKIETHGVQFAVETPSGVQQIQVLVEDSLDFGINTSDVTVLKDIASRAGINNFSSNNPLRILITGMDTEGMPGLLVGESKRIDGVVTTIFCEPVLGNIEGKPYTLTGLKTLTLAGRLADNVGNPYLPAAIEAGVFKDSEDLVLTVMRMELMYLMIRTSDGFQGFSAYESKPTDSINAPSGLSYYHRVAESYGLSNEKGFPIILNPENQDLTKVEAYKSDLAQALPFEKE